MSILHDTVQTISLHTYIIIIIYYKTEYMLSSFPHLEFDFSLYSKQNVLNRLLYIESIIHSYMDSRICFEYKMSKITRI